MSEEIKIFVNAVPFLDSFATVIWFRHAMALSPKGNKGRDQTTAPNETTVSVITMHFISAQKCLDNRDNRPRNTCVS